jgi:hypothetical protein
MPMPLMPLVCSCVVYRVTPNCTTLLCADAAPQATAAQASASAWSLLLIRFSSLPASDPAEGVSCAAKASLMSL